MRRFYVCIVCMYSMGVVCVFVYVCMCLYICVVCPCVPSVSVNIGETHNIIYYHRVGFGLLSSYMFGELVCSSG